MEELIAGFDASPFDAPSQRVNQVDNAGAKDATGGSFVSMPGRFLLSRST
jgi:hypothetical protein